jgi:RNA polymerase sigma-70 factor (ECF subfamily)
MTGKLERGGCGDHGATTARALSSHLVRRPGAEQQEHRMDVEAQIAELRAAGRPKEVATLAIESYGPEVLSFLEMMLRDHADAADAFSQACEDLWKSLPRFEGRASMKTWFYTLARHAASRLRRSSARGRLAALSEITDVADRVRSQTGPHLRTEIKHRFAEIRATLDEVDRMLLVLRVDRGMSWNDVARVLADEGGDDSDEQATRAAARLRKRFQSVKHTIRERAIATGLIPDSDLDSEP